MSLRRLRGFALRVPGAVVDAVGLGGDVSRGWRVSPRAVAASAVGLFVFTIPFEEMIVIPEVGSVTRLVGLLAFPLGLAALFHRGRITLHAPLAFVLAALLYTGWVAATFFWSQAPSATIGQIVTHVQLLAFIWLLSEFCREERQRLALLQAFVLGNYVAFSVAAFNALFVEGAGFRDVGRFDPNDFATALALGVPMAAMLATVRRPGILQVFNVVYPIVAVLGVVLAASRGGLIVGLVSLTAIPFVLPRMGLRRGLVLLAVLVSMVWLSWVYAPRLFPSLVLGVERLSGTVDELSEGTMTGRTTIWEATWALFIEAPLRGVGAGATPAALDRSELGRAHVAHNAFLSVAASTGIIGLALFLSLIAISVVSVIAAPSRSRIPLAVLCVALLVAMMPLSLEARKVTWFVLGFLALYHPIVVVRE